MKGDTKMKFYLTGDCHGDFSRFDNIAEYNTDIPVGIVCLGDFGINFFLNKTDINNKRWLCKKYSNFIFYLIKGNHEARPENLPAAELYLDENVSGCVWWEPHFPNIRYLIDGTIYTFGKYECLCIGGAYSVDKFYRLQRSRYTEENNDPKRSGWFNDEQLTVSEMADITKHIEGKAVDFVFTHTCPYSFMPDDLFLGFIDQSKVDNSMEMWFESLKDTFTWNIWCFGHFHADRLERPRVEQYFKDMEDLDAIWERWNNYEISHQLEEWWLDKGPKFYMGE